MSELCIGEFYIEVNGYIFVCAVDYALDDIFFLYLVCSPPFLIFCLPYFVYRIGEIFESSGFFKGSTSYVFIIASIVFFIHCLQKFTIAIAVIPPFQFLVPSVTFLILPDNFIC